MQGPAFIALSSLTHQSGLLEVYLEVHLGIEAKYANTHEQTQGTPDICIHAHAQNSPTEAWQAFKFESRFIQSSGGGLGPTRGKGRVP